HGQGVPEQRDAQARRRGPRRRSRGSQPARAARFLAPVEGLVNPRGGGIETLRAAGTGSAPARASFGRDRLGVRMNSAYASRCFVVVAAAALLGAAVPGRAGAADIDGLASNLVDQVQQAAWSQAAGAE